MIDMPETRVALRGTPPPCGDGACRMTFMVFQSTFREPLAVGSAFATQHSSRRWPLGHRTGHDFSDCVSANPALRPRGDQVRPPSLRRFGYDLVYTDLWVSTAFGRDGVLPHGDPVPLRLVLETETLHATGSPSGLLNETGAGVDACEHLPVLPVLAVLHRGRALHGRTLA